MDARAYEIKMKYTMKDLPQDEQPYEKVQAYGVQALTDTELLAVLLRSGTKGRNSLELAREIMTGPDGKQNLLQIHHLAKEELQEMKGIGEVKAIQILCLSELTKRMAKADAGRSLSFSSPASIAEYFMEEMRHATREQTKLLLLDTKGKMIHQSTISTGTVNASLISPRELLIEALKRNAVTMVLLHNHPSGDPTPSETDIALTKRVREAGALVGIHLLDHIIIGNNCYMSFAEEHFI